MWKNDFERRFWKEDCERKIVRDIKRQIKSVGLKEKACGDVESHFGPFSSIFVESKKMGYGRMDPRMDQRTDQRMDIPSYRDAWTHLKRGKDATQRTSTQKRWWPKKGIHKYSLQENKYFTQIDQKTWNNICIKHNGLYWSHFVKFP